MRIRGEERDPATGLLASADVLAATATIRAAVAARVDAGERPFLAGGCCAELPGALAGARDARGPVGLVHFDGHADLYDGATSPTGEAADMPVSVALGLGPAAWVEAAGGASVESGRLALLGFRDREESEREGMRQPETIEPFPLVRPVGRVHGRGAAAAEEVLEALVETAPFWLHLDVDVLDAAVFPATDYLMPNGLGWDDVGPALTTLLSAPGLVGASLGCYNPEKDPESACGAALVEAFRLALRDPRP